MSNQRYTVIHEHGSDYAVVDNKRNRMVVASGLTDDEAKIAASNRNKEDEREKGQYA